MYDGIVLVGFLIFFAVLGILIYLACTKTDNTKYVYGIIGLIGAAPLLGIILSVSAGGGSNSSSSNGGSGKYGHGEKYDRDVYDAADAFGEDPDHVNNVYEALGNEMR